MAQQEAEHCPKTQLISVADSEADIYEVLAEPPRIDWIVRACQDRAWVTEGTPQSARTVRDRLMEEPLLYDHTIPVRGRTPKIACDHRARRQPRRSRQAHVEVRAAVLRLRPPWRPHRKRKEVTINAVLVTEVDPPKNDEPIEWLLLTSLPVGDAEQVREVVQFYSVRRMVEVFFRVLKSGCRIERQQAAGAEGVSYLALFARCSFFWVAFYRIHRRVSPDCALFVAARQRRRRQTQTPDNEALELIASC